MSAIDSTARQVMILPKNVILTYKFVIVIFRSENKTMHIQNNIKTANNKQHTIKAEIGNSSAFLKTITTTQSHAEKNSANIA